MSDDPNARIPYAKVEALWNETIKLVDDPLVGLRVPDFWHPSISSSLAYAWLASSTLRSDFERLVRFLRVTTEGIKLRIEEKNGEFSLIHRFNQQALDIPQFVDAQLALLVSLCRINYGQKLDPVAIAFTHSAPEEAGEYFALFRCPVIFDAPDNRITFTQEVVDKRLISANPMLAQLHNQIMITYLANLEGNNIGVIIKSGVYG